MRQSITDEIAISILDEKITGCQKVLLELEAGTIDFENAYMEMRMYQIQKENLSEDGGADE